MKFKNLPVSSQPVLTFKTSVSDRYKVRFAFKQINSLRFNTNINNPNTDRDLGSDVKRICHPNTPTSYGTRFVKAPNWALLIVLIAVLPPLELKKFIESMDDPCKSLYNLSVSAGIRCSVSSDHFISNKS